MKLYMHPVSNASRHHRFQNAVKDQPFKAL
jgi:hypothetical protein